MEERTVLKAGVPVASRHGRVCGRRFVVLGQTAPTGAATYGDAVNTGDPRDPKDSRVRDNGYRDYRDTRDTRYTTTNMEGRTDRNWLRWAIPAAIVAVLLPFLFGRGHREPEQGISSTNYGQGDAMTSRRVASVPTSVYFSNGGSTLSDADQAKLAQVASSARQSNTVVSLSGTREQTDAVRQALISQGMPDSRIEMRESANAGSDGRVEISLAQK